MSEKKKKEKHEESTKLTADHIKGRDLSSDSEEEMDPGRVLEAGELNLEVLEGSDEEATETLEKILKAGDLKTQEDVDEAAKKILDKAVKKPEQKKTAPKKKTTRKTAKPKTVTVRYDGLLPMGTENPTRMWKRGDTMKVSPGIAERLTKHSSFTIVKRRKR